MEVRHGVALGGHLVIDNGARQQPEIAAATERQRAPHDAAHRHRKLLQRASRCSDDSWFGAKPFKAAVGARGWKHRAVDLDPLAGHDLERPQAVARDREAGRAVGPHRRAGYVRKQRNRARKIRRERLAVLPVDELMGIGVRADLVPAFGNLAHDPGVSLGDPAETEKGGSDTPPVEFVKNTLGRRLDAPFEGVPTGHVVGERMLKQVKPVLDIDSENLH